MDFDFSADERELQRQARRFLADHCDRTAVRRVLDGPAAFDADLWRGLAQQGFLGAAIPEADGGSGAGRGALCVLAEELGRALAPVPFIGSIAAVAEGLLLAGTAAQRQRWLPRLASGEAIGCLAWVDGAGRPDRRPPAVLWQDGRLSGTLAPVADGDIAHLALVLARGHEDTADRATLLLVPLDQAGITREALTSIDPTRSQARLHFDAAPGEVLGTPGEGGALLQRVLDRAAVVMAFEQIGGADRALEAACAHAQQRFAFGRPIGSLQAIKHLLAEVYVSATLARSNAYWGAWALQALPPDSPELAEAAATARVAASQAYLQAARESTQVHGGMGFTWEADCHLHHRRAQALALALGGPRAWEDRLVQALCRRHDAAQPAATPAAGARPSAAHA